MVTLRVPVPSLVARLVLCAPLFLTLAENLRAMHRMVEALRTQATGRTGMILPDTAPAPFRDTRQHAIQLPPGMAQRSSGLIVPAGTA